MLSLVPINGGVIIASFCIRSVRVKKVADYPK
jgi:hypothetical protein